jgi:hypothetical protein
MADVIGPNSYLPGQVLTVPKDMTCDEHPDKPAVVRIVGETDSMGSEMIDMCSECYAAHEKFLEEQRLNPPLNTCDWCKTPDVETRLTRDYDEGMSGPLYDVCSPCRQAANKRAQEELDEMDREDDNRDWDTRCGGDSDDDHGWKDWEQDRGREDDDSSLANRAELITKCVKGLGRRPRRVQLHSTFINSLATKIAKHTLFTTTMGASMRKKRRMRNTIESGKKSALKKMLK